MNALDANPTPGSAVRVCAVDDIADGTAQRFDLAGRRVAVVRLGDRFYALGDRCSHADVSLADGDVLADTEELECWKHGSAFSLRTGEPSCLPAVRPVPVYAVHVADGSVFISVTASEADGDAGPGHATTEGTDEA